MFLCLLYFCIVISHITLLKIVQSHKIPVDFGITINQICVRLNVIETDVFAILTNVSNDFIIVVSFLCFFYFNFDL